MSVSQKASPACDDTSIKCRLEQVFGDRRIVGEVRFADVMYDVFLSEVREQGWNVAEPAWAKLTAAAVRNVGKHIKRLLSPHAGRNYVLPAGTVAIAHVIGCVAIGWDTLCIDCDRRGLSDIFDMPCRPGGSNLVRLFQYVDELSRDQPFRAIGMPTLVDQFNKRNPDYLFQFPPFAPAADVILQREMDFGSWAELFCAMSDERIRDFAQVIINDMRKLWMNAEVYAHFIQAWRETACRVARKLRDVEVRAVTIDVSNQRSCGDRFFIEFGAWDHAYRRGHVVQEVGARNDLDRLFDEGVFDERCCDENAIDLIVLDRADHVAAVHANGADGWISGLARAVVDAAPKGACAVLADLAQNFETFVDLSNGVHEDRFRLFWQDGEICVDNQDWKTMRIYGNGLILSGNELPETVLVSLLGQPLYVVFDRPFRCNSRISSIKSDYGKIDIIIEPDRWLVNCQTGRMWAEA